MVPMATRICSLIKLYLIATLLGSSLIVLSYLNHIISEQTKIKSLQEIFIHQVNVNQTEAHNEIQHLQATNLPPKTILLWNPFFSYENYSLGFGTEPFVSFGCPRICSLTSSPGYLSDADAIIIHTFYQPKDVPMATMPVRVSKDQIFVFFILENPSRSHKALAQLNYRDVFNLTMTYLDDPQTDVYMPYGRLLRQRVSQYDQVPPEFALKQKSSQVLWLVSNCRAPSSRYEYAEQLSKYTEVDIIGKCGRDICPKGYHCLERMAHKYRFYMAFENGFCTDYITEKAFKSLETTIVPIVLGGANYTKYMPPHSYIDVRNFDSPRDLAVYLEYLKVNVTAYQEYFLWKNSYDMRNAQWHKQYGFCVLCQILYEDNYPYKSQFDPLQYWKEDMCLTGEEERKAVHLT